MLDGKKTYIVRWLAMLLVAGCAGYTPGGSMMFDTDGDPATPPVEVTQAQRCAIYDFRIGTIDAKPAPLSEYDASARTGYMLARTAALCPLPAGP